MVVLGYWGEPYARVEATGTVYLNVHSPSLAPSNDRWGRTPPTGNEDPKAVPRWVKVGDDGRLAWFDRRIHYRGRSLPPPGVNEIAKRQKLWDYRIPLLIDGRQGAVSGTLYWTGRRPFPVAIFLFLLIATAAAALFGVWAMKRVRSRG